MTTTSLKLLGILFMTIDHIGEFIPNTPIWFRWIGRLAYPLFAFCCVQGVLHTRNRKRYLLRLYIWNIIMTIVITYLNACYVTENWMQNRVSNNNFSTLFQLALLICVLDIAINKKRHYKKAIFIYICYQALMLICMFAIAFFVIDVWWTQYAVEYTFCSLFWNEGNNCFFVLLGLVFYFPYVQEKYIGENNTTFQKKCNFRCFIFYFLYIGIWSLTEIFDIMSRVFFRVCLYFGNTVEESVEFVLEILGVDIIELNTFTPPSIEYVFYENYQWMMIFSAVFFLFYNGQKGRGIKYFFYFYYILHVVLLFFIGKYL